jgi:phosphoribosylformimino-5-aminoimidazole carboxamide ribonucleotide (ProFAR) isomerase
MLGPGNDEAAREALAAWPGKLQVGGGINEKNAKEWIEAGAERVSLCVASAAADAVRLYLAGVRVWKNGS